MGLYYTIYWVDYDVLSKSCTMEWQRALKAGPVRHAVVAFAVLLA